MTLSPSRNISQLTQSAVAVVLAGGRGTRLEALTKYRSKPALHYGGKFRLIDFPLSNCINSGIRRIGVVTQYKSHSLIRHLMNGWGGFNRHLGEYIDLLPASQQYANDWYKGTADALYQNLQFIQKTRADYVIVLSGDQVYRMDYGELLADHVKHDADVTVACLPVQQSEARGKLGIAQINDEHRIIDFVEKPHNPCEIPGRPGWSLASMGIYVFNTDFLVEKLKEDAVALSSRHDFGHNIIPDSIKRYRTFAYTFEEQACQTQYWKDVGTLDNYFQANMDLLTRQCQFDLFDQHWPIWTYHGQTPPARFSKDECGRHGLTQDSLISGGCEIVGAQIIHSLLFTNVKVEGGATVEHCVILPETTIGQGASLKRVIVDSHCTVPAGIEIGHCAEADKRRGFTVTQQQITLVTQEMLDKMPLTSQRQQQLHLPTLKQTEESVVTHKGQH
ncbi:glucose-1-phosphate adenylyltransferase [Aestuariibacter halophilus]|uniref:Glucose-1-phosphate adenylyltransferase n=1 Tax=Fluctibacter halophilus TaxID=226011 RepID=A0ABS8G524_9ALTE|nr:glucose-1-phosphate adenylyltransferase [Aestuariibacter halophilus]MCC2615687.1 glucose-1-phosphate adenylyltransferase [Aestuariibacter halophilus]